MPGELDLDELAAPRDGRGTELGTRLSSSTTCTLTGGRRASRSPAMS